MLASSAPSQLIEPIAVSGDKNTIATTGSNSDNTVNLPYGFTLPFSVDPNVGGQEVQRQDMNAFLNITTNPVWWQNTGNFFTYNSGISTAIGGYANNAYVGKADYSGLWRSTVDNNTTNPDTGGSGWILAFRQRLSANLTLYVSVSGSDTANTGLNSGSPFATIQHAFNVAAMNYDFCGYQLIIQLLDSTSYTAGLSALLMPVGIGGIIIQGNPSAPNNVVITTTGSNCFYNAYAQSIELQYMQLSTITSGDCIAGNNPITIGAGITFGACAGNHISGNVLIQNSYTIAGNATHHLYSDASSITYPKTAITVTLTGIPVFTSFALAQYSGGNIFCNSGLVTFSGSATGIRYYVSENALIDTNGGGDSLFPGSSAGSTATGGQYV